ncbi:protein STRICTOSIDINE SYNTHASE-LIKE 10-like [Hordeum vulgare subsp. vulgare]|uniref:protein STRICTOSIDINE SYNTHASE-LIKE 10-like n=1 Tax=Hordeum vulgare subsp. vulgare TaxID=112509 RepID=UPI001D1A544F|nr:protein STRICTOSIDINE SYNTHASE-LIKE 10-like [Hordeum vulgare subsp. vulgare]
MGRRGSASGWLVLLAALLAASLVPSCAAAEVKTSPTEWSMSLSLPLPSGVTGAESLAFDARGQGPYTSVSDGRVLKWGGGVIGWTTFAHHANYRKFPMCTMPVAPSQDTEGLCGRPLGLAFHRKSGDLYIADAYKGLMRVGPDDGEAEVLATSADGIPFNFVNSIDIDQDTDDVYFTDSSVTYPRRCGPDEGFNASNQILHGNQSIFLLDHGDRI